MTSIAKRVLPGMVLAAMVFVLSGAEVQCGLAEARPSLSELQTQIDELRLNQVRAFDANGDELGPWLGAAAGVGDSEFFSPAMGAVVLLREDNGEIGAHLSLLVSFAEPNCQGLAYLEEFSPGSRVANRLVVTVVPGGVRYFVVEPTEIENITVASSSRLTDSDDNPDCNEGVRTLGVAQILTEVTGSLPFSVPIPVPIQIVPAQ